MQQAEQVLTDLVSRFRPEAASGMKATFQLELDGDEGGLWHVVVADGKCQLRQGTAAGPEVTIAMTTEDFGALIAQRLDAMQAYSDGRIKVKGNLWLAMQLGELFGF
jgi:putative sterol carrier protein